LYHLKYESIKSGGTEKHEDNLLYHLNYENSESGGAKKYVVSHLRQPQIQKYGFRRFAIPPKSQNTKLGGMDSDSDTSSYHLK